MIPPAWQACAAAARSTLNTMGALCPPDARHRDRLHDLHASLARLAATGDANGICSLFDEISFDYSANNQREIIRCFAN
ncbi:MAG: hypothetical protein JHD02_00190 [Thermoleophilaceae bacterium]|nr:hypothetical protein [Thermoleophilaceae bacterium]